MMKKILFTVLITLLCQAAPSFAAKFPANGAEFLNTCRLATEGTEKKLRLPKRLLNSISLAETGRWYAKNKEIIAWPWTVYSEGRGRYLPSKAAAISEVLKLKKKGVKNIDVGCMQVNLHWHPNAFKSLENAFDPQINAQYAGNLLRKLQRENRSWNVAVAHYHSQTKKYNVPYKKKVLKIWQDQRRKDTAVRMEKARATYRKRRDEIFRKRDALRKKKQEALQVASNS